jgi:hypothetical protein
MDHPTAESLLDSELSLQQRDFGEIIDGTHAVVVWISRRSNPASWRSNRSSSAHAIPFTIVLLSAPYMPTERAGADCGGVPYSTEQSGG